MTARQVTIRDAVYDQIVADESGYVITDLEIAKTFYPRKELESIGTKPHVWVVAKAPSTTIEGELRAPKAVIYDFQVQVHLQQRLQPESDDFETNLETLTELYEQLLDSCVSHTLVSGSSYLFQRIEPLQDENAQVYSYEDLTQDNKFNAIFTAFYQFQRQPT
jgi:hypothetical protein